MTGYTVHTGTTVKFSEAWDRIFQERAAKSKPAKKKPVSGAAKVKTRAKRTLKKKR